MVNVHFDNIRQQIISALEKASERIIVAVYWFTNEELFEKLIQKIEKGCTVELIIHNDFIVSFSSSIISTFSLFLLSA